MVKIVSPFEGPWASAKPNLFAYSTAEWRSKRPVVNIAKCRHCGVCYFYCPVGSVVDRGSYCDVDLSFCKGCGVCAKECPSKAIIMVREMD